MVLVPVCGHYLVLATQNSFTHYRRKTLFQLTLERISHLNQSLANFQNPIIVTNENHRFIVAEQLRQQRVSAQILLEPIARNTALQLQQQQS